MRSQRWRTRSTLHTRLCAELLMDPTDAARPFATAHQVHACSLLFLLLTAACVLRSFDCHTRQVSHRQKWILLLLLILLLQLGFTCTLLLLLLSIITAKLL